MDDRFQKDIEYVVNVLYKAGYDPYEQLYAYVHTGNITYITRKGDAREIVANLDREKIMKFIEPYIRQKKMIRWFSVLVEVLQ